MEFPASNGLPGHQGPPQDDDDYSSDLFKSDEFRLWCMKVIPCTKRFVHDWTICPFAHAGEKAVRRDPRLHNYTGIACPDMKKTGSCIRGEKCPYAHNVFEYWLHPTRYRTQLCNDGPMCRRGICFFAHSLEELRVPACKPYVSPEALARASLEAIQQNPHPLGQQLPNPVAAAQQQAAMAAMGGRGGHGAPHGGGMRGMRDPRDAGPSSLAPSAMPFVPGSAGAGGGGSFRPSGEPVRYSAPGAMPLLGGSPGGDYGHSMGDYGSMGAGHGGPARQGSYGGHPGMQAQQAAAYQQQQQRWAAQQAHQSTYGSMPGVGGGPRGPPARGPDMGAGSAPADSGMRMAAAVARQRSSGDGGAGGYYPSAPARVPSPAGGHRGFSSFAAVQHPPEHGFGRPAQPPAQPFGSYQTVEASQPSLGAPVGSGSAHSSHGSDSGSEAPRPGTAGPPAAGAGNSGRDSPAVTDDLAQSLASLKIALTQQQLAAAAGSNHEVVISTLHQILKDAMAQQGGSFGAGPAAGGTDNGAAATTAAALYAAQQGLACGDAGGWGSPNAAAGASFGSAPSTISSSLAGSMPIANLPLSGRSASGDSAAPSAAAAGAAAGTQGGGSKGGTPPLSSSPDAMACYQAAAVAAAAGYPALMRSRGPGSGGGSPLADTAEVRESALVAAAGDSA